MASNRVFFTHHGNDVTFDPAAKMWSLTAMHQAAGGEPHKAPAQWLRNQQTHDLIAALEAEGNYAHSHNSVETRRGTHGGTWTHGQIAAAYAHYLRPDFSLPWNRWAMERVTGQGPPDDSRLTARESRLGVIETRLTTVRLSAEFPHLIAQTGAERSDLRSGEDIPHTTERMGADGKSSLHIMNRMMARSTPVGWGDILEN